MYRENWNPVMIKRKCIAISLAAVMMISSIAIFQVAMPENASMKKDQENTYPSNPIEVNKVLTDEGLWIGLDSNTEGSPAEAHVTISDTSGITIVADFHGFWKNNVTLNGTQYDSIDMPGASYIRETGKPMVPRFSEFVEIPIDIDVTLEVLHTESTNISGLWVRPAQSPLSPRARDESNTTGYPVITPSFNIDGVYTDGAIFPGYETDMEGDSNSSSMIMRGRRILDLSFYPVQFDTATNRCIVFSEFIVKLKYSHPAQINPVPLSLRSEAFEKIYAANLLNYDSFQTYYNITPGYPEPIYSPVIYSGGSGAEYLIITIPAFKDEAERLASWKTQKGVLTEVVTVFPGSSPQTIKSIVRDVYNNWNPKPTYCLLLGDSEAIPTNYDMVHMGEDGDYGDAYDDVNGKIGSDLIFFTVHGNDDFPDMIYGRLSVDTPTQAQRVVSKILAYEKTPPEVSSFYQNILSAAFFEDACDSSLQNDGWEDEESPYVYYAEEIRQYLKQEGYIVHVNYSAKEGHTETGKEYLSPEYLWNGVPVADALADVENFHFSSAWSNLLEEGANNIIDNINEGRFLIYHLDHGGSLNQVYSYDSSRDSREGWFWPALNVVNPDATPLDLDNNEKTPLIMSMACNTGWFDGEIDQYEMDNDNFDDNENLFDENHECIAEYLTRMEDGALAYIGASRLSYTMAGIELMRGIFGAFWPEYLGLNKPSQPLYEIGAALLMGKIHVARLWKNRDTEERIVDTTSRIFHLFGDPELQLRTESPSEFEVSHPISVDTYGTSRFVVTVRNKSSHAPVTHAKVCILQEPNVYRVGYTNSMGQVIFEISKNYPFIDGPANITVTNHNYIPYESNMNVMTSGAVVDLSSYSGLVDDDIHMWLSGFDEAREIRIYFEDLQIGEIPGTIPGTTDEFIIEIPDGPTGFFNLRIVQVWPSLPEMEWEPLVNLVFRRLETGHGPDPYLYSQYDSTTWDETNELGIYDNPDIVVLLGGEYPVTLIDEVVPLTQYTVGVFVHNSEDIPADGTNVTLSYSTLGGGLSWTFIGKKTVDVPREGIGYVSFQWKPLLRLSTCLKVLIEHEQDSNLLNNIGYENLNTMTLSSPGQQQFFVGNPTEIGDYVYIKVRQQSNCTDIWNATISNYTSQLMGANCNESISIYIDPGTEIEFDDWNIFTMDLYINGELVGGVTFKAIKLEPRYFCLSDPVCVTVLVSICVAAAAAVIVIIQKRRRM